MCITAKRYRCVRCGHETMQSTNHYGPTWSWGRVNVCPNCPPWAKYPEFGGSTVWECIETGTALDDISDGLPPDAPRYLFGTDLGRATLGKGKLHHTPKAHERTAQVNGAPAIVGRQGGTYYWYRPGDRPRVRRMSHRIKTPAHLATCGIVSDDDDNAPNVP